MANHPGPSSWMLVLVMSVYLGTDALQVKYPKALLLGVEGQSLKLTCNAEYVFTSCGQLDLSWLKEDKSVLTDILKYLTTVNETQRGDSRRRQTVTEFLHLVPGDQGLYQCVASCTRSGRHAMGHFINITVKAAPADSQQYANSGPLSRGSDPSLTLWSLMAAWASLEGAYTFI